MWVVTKAINEYNQEGDYLVCVFDHKPNASELKKVLIFESDEVIQNLIKKGGRMGTEYQWYFLVELQNGEVYQESYP